MRRVLCAVLLAGLSSAAIGASQAPPITVRVDSRVELLSLIFRLAGAPEYDMCRLEGYEAEMDRAFGRFNDHAAVQLAGELRERHGIGFDAVVSFALSATPPPSLVERVPFGPNGEGLADKRWHGPHAAVFLDAVRRFSRDSGFPEFIAKQHALYSATEGRLQALVEERMSLDWYHRFFGEPAGADFIVIPGMCNGSANFGPTLRLPNGREELYAILGVTRSDAEGIPVFDARLLPTLVHEFAHAFIKPFVQRHREELATAGNRLFPHVSSTMATQAYGSWDIVIEESLVRAAVVRYLRGTGDAAGAARELRENLGLGFVWIEDLDRLLHQYEQQRDRIRQFDQFAPQMVSFFDEVSRSIEDRLEALDARRPTVASMTPADGAKDVDPALTRIVIVFDRPMATGYSINFGPGGKATYPEVGAMRFEPDGRTFVMQVRLQPASDYEFLLTGRGFRSAEGIPLRQRLLRFRTRPAR